MLEELKKKPLIIAGPCSVESQEQIDRIASQLAAMGLKYLRGGAFKPRTSPKSFQGIGGEGLEFMRRAADKHKMRVVSEVMDGQQLEKYIDLIDIVQIGSKNMTAFAFLKQVGKLTAQTKKPVLLKRGFHSTISEFLYAAEYIRQEGNPNIILCLRGIRTFEQIDSLMRFTPDLAGIVELRARMGEGQYPVFFDPSHSTGNSGFVADIAKAALGLGANGLLIETHDHPDMALSDEKQCILPSQVKILKDYIDSNY